MDHGYAKSGSDHLSYGLPGGRRIDLFDTILGPPCGRCGKNVEDIAFLVEGQDGAGNSGGLCGSCLEEILAAACASEPGAGYRE